MIKPIKLSIAGLLVFSSVCVADTCPIKISTVGEEYFRCVELLDDALDSNTAKNVALADRLRDEAEAAFQSDQHAKSIILLRKAMRAAGI